MPDYTLVNIAVLIRRHRQRVWATVCEDTGFWELNANGKSYAASNDSTDPERLWTSFPAVLYHLLYFSELRRAHRKTWVVEWVMPHEKKSLSTSLIVCARYLMSGRARGWLAKEWRCRTREAAGQNGAWPVLEDAECLLREQEAVRSLSVASLNL